MRVLFVCLFLAAFLGFGQTAYCRGRPGQIHNNTSPIVEAPPRFIKQVSNGKLFEVGDDQHNNRIKLIHVYGNMYEMGYAQGLLLKEELNQFVDLLWNYIQSEFSDGLVPKWVPAKYRLKVAGLGAAAALDLTYQATRLFTDNKYYQEIKGISDGANIDFLTLRRVHMIGQLTKGTCSMFGAWGKATLGNKTIQLRSLDWDFDGPYWRFPLLTVYHPNSNKLGSQWMNIGFMGFVGVISGINQHQLAVSQIGVYFADQTWGKTSRIGNPFTFVLRDILQFDDTLEKSVQRLKSTRRTCTLLLGVGDGKLQTNSFRGFQYSHTVCNDFTDNNLEPVTENHARIQNIVYWGMDWNCTYYDQRFSQLLNEQYGSISAETTISHILPGLTSGNLQAVVYDLSAMEVYIAYGFVVNGSKINAYDRSFVKLSMKQIFS